MIVLQIPLECLIHGIICYLEGLNDYKIDKQITKGTVETHYDLVLKESLLCLLIYSYISMFYIYKYINKLQWPDLRQCFKYFY